jgi:hypothetical protein
MPAAPKQKHFGVVISDAEDLTAKKAYKEALELYRTLDSQLTGSGEYMKIQFVRERIENVLRLIQENPGPENADVIEQERKAAEERFHTTVYEAESYFNHKLYTEALFLYRKLQKEWAESDDVVKKSFIMSKLQALRELQDDIFMEEEEPEQSVKEAYKEEEKFIGGYVQDGMQIQVVIESPSEHQPVQADPDPALPDPVEEPFEKTHDQLYEESLLEAENYHSHELYSESLYLYKKLENELTGKKLVVSDFKEKLEFVREKARVLQELAEDPYRVPSQPGDASQVAFLDEDGTISDEPIEGFEEGPGFSRFARAMTVFLLKNKAFLNIVYILLFAGGIWSLFNIPVENMPSVDLGEAYITTYYYGASAEDVENLITTQIEKSIEGIRSEERRVGKECRRLCRSRWSPYH